MRLNPPKTIAIGPCLAYPWGMRFSILPMAAVLLLAGCADLQELKSDLAGGFKSIGDSVVRLVDPVKEAKKQLPIYDGTCPTATVRPDLARLVEFYSPEKPTEATRISTVEILGIENVCRVEDGKLLMQIDLALSGTTGPKARIQPTDKPSFAYPYFVAVTDAAGVVVSKEIFVASMVYGPKQNDLRYTESIFQTMPFPDAASGQIYNVVVGFQLSPEQHAYNNANPVP